MSRKIKTILIGTSEFAAKIFEKLLEVSFPKIDIIAIITAPDKPTGRKQEIIPSPVKKFALNNLGVKLPNCSILQPEKISSPEWIEKIKKLNPNLIILAAYGQIVPREILDIVSPRPHRQDKYGALNIHPSLLPRYRGASPIQAAILSGDKISGVTIMLMDEEMDHGPIISNFQFSIFNKPTYEELSKKLADVAAELMIKTLPDWIEGKIKAKPQEHSKATFCKIIKKQDGRIDWRKSAEEIERQIRAFHKWPGAYTKIKDDKPQIISSHLTEQVRQGRYQNRPVRSSPKIKNKILKILEADVSKENIDKRIGEVFLTNNKELAIQTGKGVLILKQVQLESRKQVSARDFLNGHPEIIGTLLK